MAEHPIIFTGDRPRGIIEGRITQTRRIIKPQPISTEMCPAFIMIDVQSPSGFSWHSDMYGTNHIKCTYGKVGDMLWVRETWQAGIEWDDEKPSDIDPLCGGNDINYIADGKNPTEGWGKVRPSIFMPRWAARIFLEITGMRDERVQDIDAVEAEAEGIRRPKRLCPDRHDEYILERFQRLWDSINANRGYAWPQNPVVKVIEFKNITEALKP